MHRGGTLILGAGSSGGTSYLITSLVVTHNINIQCTSPAIRIFSTTPGTVNGNQQPSGAMITFSGRTGGGVFGCTIDGNYPIPPPTFMEFKQAIPRGFTFVRNVFQKSRRHGGFDSRLFKDLGC